MFLIPYVVDIGDEVTMINLTDDLVPPIIARHHYDLSILVALWLMPFVWLTKPADAANVRADMLCKLCEVPSRLM